MSYLLQADTHNRCMAFLVWETHKKIKALKQMDPTEELGKQLRTNLRKDELTKNLQLPEIPGIKEKIAAQEALLQTPEYQLAESEYQKLRDKKVSNPAWHQMFGGPDSMQELAKRLDLVGIYEVLYRNLSGPTHGTDIVVGKISRANDGTAEIIQLRHPANVQEVTKWALILSIKEFELYISNRLPDKESDYAQWYLSIREPFLKVTSREKLLIMK